MKYQSNLSILDFRLFVHLGWSDEEKLNPQPISLNIHIDFDPCPKAADTDQLDHTICYQNLTEGITDFCKDKRFNLIEHLAKSTHQYIESLLYPYKGMVSSLTLEAHKLAPPLKNVHKGVVFTYKKSL